MTKVAIFDVDGTLMNVNHRRHYVSGPNKDWKAFNEAMVLDTPNEAVFQLAASTDLPVIVVSGRNERHRDVTERQLQSLDYIKLIMRPDDNYDPDHVFKQEVLDIILESQFDVEFVVDDRPSVVQMWRKNGLTCFDVGGFDE
jgi:phosphoglycolate phosphatase-like HAD superfamily hydrolase|tara:strand:- start:354 stop:779 length:426 start_codon:yes stop_codon:yes gene_type:complete